VVFTHCLPILNDTAWTAMAVHGVLGRVAGLRLDAEAEFNGAVPGMHKVSAADGHETNGRSG